MYRTRCPKLWPPYEAPPDSFRRNPLPYSGGKDLGISSQAKGHIPNVIMSGFKCRDDRRVGRERQSMPGFSKCALKGIQTVLKTTLVLSLTPDPDSQRPASGDAR